MTYKCIGTCECPKGISPMNEHGEKKQSINLAVEKSQLEKAIQILAKKCWKSAISSNSTGDLNVYVCLFLIHSLRLVTFSRNTHHHKPLNSMTSYRFL